jgi:hypothetical protein
MVNYPLSFVPNFIVPNTDFNIARCPLAQSHLDWSILFLSAGGVRKASINARVSCAW